MTLRTYFAAQLFRRDKAGRLAHAARAACRSAEDATNRARSSVESGKAVGAVALIERDRGEFDLEDPPEVLATFGDVPAGQMGRVPF